MIRVTRLFPLMLVDVVTIYPCLHTGVSIQTLAYTNSYVTMDENHSVRKCERVADLGQVVREIALPFKYYTRAFS